MQNAKFNSKLKILVFYLFLYFLLDYGITYFAVKNGSRIEVNPLNVFLVSHFGPVVFLALGFLMILIFGLALFFLNRYWREFLPIVLRAFLIATVINAVYLFLTALELVFGFSFLRFSPTQILIFLIPTFFFTAFYLFFAWRKKWGFWFCFFGQISSALVIFLVAK